MNIFELSLRSLVSEDKIRQFLAVHRGVALSQIGAELEYLDRINTSGPLALGLEVLFADTGFQTFAKWIEEFDIAPPDFVALASAAAREFSCEAVIGDVLDVSGDPGYFLVLFPDGAIKRAVELTNSDIFDVQLLNERR